MSRTRLFVSAIFIVLIGLISASPLWADGLIPPASPTFTVGANPQVVLLVDVDGDNKLDLVVAESGTNQLQVFQGNGDGTFTAVAKKTIALASAPVALAAGVLTGGTHPDIVIATSDGTVTVLRNTSAPGTFNLAATANSPYTPAVSANPQSVAVADIDGDGNNDVVVADKQNNQVVVMLGDGSAALPLTSKPTFAVGSGPVALVVASFGFAPILNQKSSKDIAVVNGTAGTVTILQNNTVTLGTPVFVVAQTPSVGSGPVAIAAGSVGATGPDLVVANSTSQINVLLNNGSGTFAAAATYSLTQAPTPNGIVLGDFNGDGFADVVVSAADGAELLFNDKTGKFPGPVVTSAAGTGPAAIAIGDLNITGPTFHQQDVVVANGGATNVNIFLGTTLTNVPVADPLLVQASGNLNGTTIATFTDDITAAVPSDFNTAGSTVDLGDGTTGTCSSTGGSLPGGDKCTIGGAAGSYSVTTKHSFADGYFTITVNAEDTNDSVTGPMVTHISITKLNTPTTVTLNGFEGAPFPTTTQVGKFGSSRGGAVAGDFTDTIDWGDCGDVNNLTPGPCPFVAGSGAVAIAGPPAFAATGGHTYKAQGTYTINVVVTDTKDNNSKLFINGSTATITEAPLVKDNVAIATQFATEGAAATTFNAGVFWDEDTAEIDTSHYTIKINWGDGTSDTAPSPNVTVTGPTAGTDPNANPAIKWVVTGKHSYVEGGKDACGLGVNPAVCNITVDITDTDLGGSSITTNASVVNVSDATLTGTTFPINAGVVNVTTFAGPVATWVDNNPAATDLTDYPAALPAVTVDFKDGLVKNCISGGNAPIADPTAGLAVDTCEYFLDLNSVPVGKKTVVAKHIYTAAVTQTVITINDKGGASATVTDTVTVTSISSTTPVTNVPVVEGINMSPDLVGTFVSQRSGASGNASQFNQVGTSINWGDGTTDNAPSGNINIVQNPPGACPCTFEVHGTHAFANLATPAPLTRNITVTVKDSIDSSTATINSTAVESDGTISGVAPAGSPLPATEGVKIAANTKIGRFLDSNPKAAASDYSEVVVNWNDPNNGGVQSKLSLGQITLVATGNPGEFDIEVAGVNGYQYREVSNPTVTFVVSEKGGFVSAALNGVTFNVADAKPLVAGPALQIDKNNGGGALLLAKVDNFTGNNGLVATFTDPNPFALVGDFNISIDWGDGVTDTCNAPCAQVTQTGGVGTTFQVTPGAGHIFQKAGTQLTAVKVTITDKSDVSNTITVNDGLAKVTSLTNPVFQNITPTEGAAFNGAVGTFDTTTGSSSFTATITWGDGNVSPATSFSGGPTTWAVNGTNTYAEETPHVAFCGGAPTCAISILVTDSNDGSTLTISGGTATVADALITGVAVGPIAGSFTEGNSTGTIIVGAFTDGNPNAPVADFPPANVVIHWGDGQQSNGAVVANGVSGCLVQFCVTGSHIYAEGGTDAPAGGLYTISIDVKDIGGSNFAGFAASSIQVADAPLTNMVVNLVTGGQGPGGALVANVDNFNGTVATFHDTNTSPSSTPADFVANINWGDGVNTAGVVVATGGGNYNINGSHTFALAGTQLNSVIVTVTDVGGAPPLTAAGPVAKVTSLYLPTSANVPAVEGVLFTGTVGGFTATTGHATFAATINWGDGNNSAASFSGGPAWTVSGSNMYTDEDAILCGAGCAITFTVTDTTDGSTLNIAGGKANVADAALGAVPVPTIVAAAGQPLSNALAGQFQDANTLAPVTDFSGVIVHWNDPNNPGATSPGTLVKVATPAGQPTQFQILASYVGYAINGTYGVTFDVVDKGGSKIVGGTGVTVTNAPGVLSGTPKNLTPASGVIANTVIASFTNSNPALPVTDYSGTVNWGDGTPTQPCSSSSVTTPACFYQATATPGTFNVIGSHTYLLLGQTFPITVVVNDAIGGATVTINSSANIPNVVLTDFLGSTSPPQSLIKAGQSVDVLVTVSPNPNTPPFGTPVTFTGCTILSGPALSGLTCSFSPTSVPNVLQVYQVHVTVQSFATVAMQTAPPRPGSNGLKQLALLLPGFAGLFGMVLLGGTKKNRRHTALWFGAGLLLLALLLVGCGGGAGLVTPTGGGASTVPGTYVVQINTSDGSAVGPCSITGTGPCLTAQVTITK